MSTYATRRIPGQRGDPLCAHCRRLRRTAPRGRFCSDACKQIAYRRRKAGLPENLHPSALGAYYHRNDGDLHRYVSAAGLHQ